MSTSRDFPAPPPLSACQRRILAVLRQPGGTSWADISAGRLRLRRRSGRITLGAGEAPLEAADGLVARGLAVWSQESSQMQLLLPDARQAACPRPLEAAEIGEPDGRRRVLVNTAESPLAWLRRRRGRDGLPLLGDDAFTAGERLRADLTVAGMLPSVTIDWTKPFCDVGARSGERLNASDAAIAARQRVRAALKDVGPDFADLLVDLCGFLKPLGQIESERGWPVRSAKVMAVAALRLLARHYGIAPQASGPDHARKIRRWGDEDYRPRIA